MVCNLLTQIFVVAERTRAAKSSRRRSVPSEEPLSLIELIQASYSVFERYGIGPPDDAAYHRYLLSLSINPERDWRKKILSFDVGSQPKVKRLCTARGHRHAETHVDSNLRNRPDPDPVSHSTGAQRRQRAESKLSTPLRRSAPTFDQGQRDRFGDMLSLESPIQRVHAGDENRRAFSAVEASGNTTKQVVGRVVPLPDLMMYRVNGDEEEMPSTGKDSAKRMERIAAGERHLQMITTSIEQWRATQAVKQLVTQNKLQRLTTPLCIHAMFHWVALCLPEKNDFHATESPRALPLRILRRIDVDVKVLRHFAQKVWVWQAKTLLKVWHADAHKRRTFRVRMIIKQRAAVLETAFQCIQRWRLFTETQKCSADRARWVAQRCSRSKLRVCLLHWSRRFQSRQRQHRAVRHHSSRVFSGVLRSWQSVLQSERDERCRYEMARKRRVLARWKLSKERRQTSRALLCVASDQRKLRVLTASWDRLRANVAQNETSRTRMSLWEEASTRRRRRRFFRRWKRAVDRSGDFREREERFGRYRRRRTLSQMFATWATWTERQMTLEKVLSDAMETRSARQIRFCFKNWKSYSQEALLVDEELAANVVRLRRRGVWNQWRKRTGTRSATRYLDSAYSFHLFTKVFASWKQHVVRKSELCVAFEECQRLHKLSVLSLHWKLLVANVHSHQQKQFAVESLRQRKLREVKKTYLLGWQGHLRGVRDCRLRGEQLKSVRRQDLMRSTWKSWRRVFWMRTVARLADDQLSTYRKTRAFRSWKQFVLGSTQRRERSLKVVELLGSFHLHACLRQWKERMAFKHRLARQAELVEQMICRHSWMSWRIALETKRGQHETLAAVASRWQSRQLDASFHSWKATWRIRKRHRHLLQSTLLTSHQRVLESHFKAWKKRWRVAAACEHKSLAIQDKLLHFKAKRAVGRWNALRLDQDRRSRLVVKSLALWRQSLLKSAFLGLLAYKQERKQRQLQTQLARARYRRRSTQFCFLLWSKWWQRKEEMTAKRDATKLHLDRLRIKRSLERLKLDVQARKRLKTAHLCAVAMSSGHAKIAAFSRWKAFIAQKHSNRRANGTRVVSMRNFRARKRIQRWREHLQVQKLMKKTLARAVTASTSSQLQLRFRSWKTFAARQVFTRTLKKKAAAFRYFCLLPLYFRAWKACVRSRQRNEVLLLRARGLWCHRSEHRAFTAWVQFAVDKRQTKCAVAKWTNRAISRSFASWKRFRSLEKKRLRDRIRAVNFFERRTCHRILRNWQSTARRDRLTRKCTQMWHQSTSRRVFELWTRHVRLLQVSRRLLAKMRSQSLSRVFTAWKESNRQQTHQLQGIQERFALLWRLDARSTSFARWKRYAHLRRLIRRKLGGQRDVLLRDVVKAWRRTIVSRQRASHCELLLAERAKLNVMKTLWSDWRTKAKVLRSVNALRGKVAENRVTSDLRQRLRRWKQFALLSFAVKRFVHRGERELVRLAFVAGFRRFTQLKRSERALAKQIGSVHENYLKAWLARRLQQRMSAIAACEAMRQAGSSKRLLESAWVEWTSFHARKLAQQAAVRQLRVQVSRLEDVDSPLDRRSLSLLLRRWQGIQTARVFERWSDVIQSQQRARLHTLQAMEWWQKRHSGRYFRGWVLFRQQQWKRRRIRAMNEKFKLKRTWELWQRFNAASLRKKTINLSARELHDKSVYRRSLGTWRAAARSLRLQREQILELYHSSRLRLLAALLGEWRKFAAMERTTRMQKTVARVVHDEKVTRRSFAEWKTNVAGMCFHRRQLQINTERLQVLLLCSSFRAWRSWSLQHKKLRTVMLLLSAKCDSRAASQFLTAWRLHAEKNAGLRLKTSSFLRFRRLQKGLTGLRSLVHEQQSLRAMRQKAQLFRSALSGNELAMIFTRWKQFAVLTRKTRAVTLQYLQNKLLPAAWSSWAAFVKTRRERKEKTLTAALGWKNAFLRKAWNALVLAHKVQQETRDMMTRAELHHRKSRLRNAVADWCANCSENRHFRAVCGKLLARWRMQTAYRCFCALRDRAVYRKTLRASESVVSAKVRASALLQAWYAWRKLLLISRAGKRRLLHRYWAAWSRSRDSRKVLQGFRERIQARVLRSTQRRCMELWTQFVASRKMEKAMALMSTAFADTQVVRRKWLCWLKFVAQTRAIKARMRNALAHMHLQLQFKAFRALQAYTSHRKWKTHATARLEAFRSRQLLTRSFVEWKAVVSERIDRRRKLGHYLNVMQHSVQRKSFGGWSSFATRRKLLRAKMAQALAMRSQLCSRIVFQTWKSVAAKAQKNTKARAFSAAKASARAVRHWKQYVVLCRVEQMIGTCELRQVESSFLSWRKAVAATHQLRAFRAKAARRHWLQLVGMAFKSWKQRSETHAHCRTLLASVAIGNHLRFRFMLWQRFTAHRKRLANLLLVVADPPSSSLTGEEGSLADAEPSTTAIESERGSVDGSSELVALELEASTDDHQLVSLGHALAKKARVLQRFDVTWDLPQAWHRWRQLFHAQLFYRMRRLQLHFICWQKFAHAQRRSRWIVIKLTSQRRAASAHTIFRAWAELVGRVKQLQKDRLRERELWVLVTTEMARRERRQLKAHWHAWRFHVDEARHLQKSLDAYHRARLLTKHWLVWQHDFRQLTRRVRLERERVATQMRSFHLRRALRSLRQHQQRAKRARLVLEYFGNRRYDTLLPAVLSRWKQWSQRQKDVARCLEAARTLRTRRHFTAWKTWKSTRKWQRVVVNKLQSKSVDQHRREVWRRWRRYVKTRAVKDLSLQQAVVFHVRSRLRKRWLRHAQRALQLREQEESAHVQLCVFRGHRAVGRWRDYSRSRRLRRLYQRFVLRKHVQQWQFNVKHAMATRFDEFLLRSKAKKMLAAWKQVAAKHHCWRHLCATFVGEKATQTVRRGFRRWQQLVHERQVQRLAVLHAQQGSLRRVWRCWSCVVRIRQLQLAQAAEHEARSVLGQSLSVWQAAVKKQRERRFILLSCVVKLQSVAGQRVQEVIFRSWKRLVERERQCQRALIKRDCNVAKRALALWSLWTRSRQQRQQQLESAANYHAQRLKSSVFFYWQTYALAWQDAAKPIARRRQKVVAEPGDNGEDSDDSDVRRPTSPVMKRLRQKTNRTRPAEVASDASVTLPDAVEISMDVKKRLLLLGKWKPPQNAKAKKLLSSS
ncbi:uncharacterized protein KRP23_4359 [Phytophthora ramorum]|uniref:uncharacterized protein n=1 Tax=Phytophthora ramorum TaxID=164328 RepID=UPI0030A825DB|nr:hypothetical protein KRP23_4359 [Phytophthora ramorum]